ncbi:MAG TPA: dienelactone hydrolase family protein, partial [Thermoanaerobaculia bacterium]|nr:dienelactone hydrolase family protein [Thermoanaerobaculia bacterium]
MRRISVIALSLILAVACAKKEAHDTTPTETRAIAPAAPPQPNPGQVVTFGNGASGYLAMPATGTKHPGLIVIQEWWGVDDWVREQTDRFAREGYVALAVDLYRGRSTHDPGEAHELMRGLPQDRAISDLKAGIALLGNQPEVDPTKIGVIGWCMGGGYSLQLALAEPRLAACVMNYGSLVTDEHTLTKLSMPLL